LNSGDYHALGKAIDTEWKLVEQQKSWVEAHLRVFKKALSDGFVNAGVYSTSACSVRSRRMRSCRRLK